MALSDFAGSYTELDGSMSSRTERGVTRGTRMFKVRWADAEAMRAALYGYVLPANANRIIASPDQWPSNAAMYCRSVTIEPMGRIASSDNPITYDYARITAEYDNEFVYGQVPDQDQQQSPSTSETLDFEGDVAAEFLNTSAAYYRWSAAPSKQVPLDQVPTILVPSTTVSIPISGDVRPPNQVTSGRIGKINLNPFLNRPTGQVLYLGCQFKRRRVTTITPTVNGGQITSTQIVYDYIHKFAVKDRDWRLFYNAETGAWDYIVSATFSMLYETAELAEIIPT